MGVQLSQTMGTRAFPLPLPATSTGLPAVAEPSAARPLTGCAVVPTGSIRTGFDDVPISVPDALRRFTCNARDAVMRAAAALPEVTDAKASLNTPPILLSMVVPAVKPELSVNPAAAHPTTQLTRKAVLPLSTTLAPERVEPPSLPMLT